MEPRAYFDPPSEREWTDEERDEFFDNTYVVTDSTNTQKGMNNDAIHDHTNR